MGASSQREEAPTPSDFARALAAWREHDAARALHGCDRAAIDATVAARALVLERLVRPRVSASASGKHDSPPRDLFSACARLGALLAEAGASPTLAVSTIDGAVQALEHAAIPFETTRITHARASVAEGYVAAILEAERSARRREWEYPSCTVRVDEETVAIVAGYPTDDTDGLPDWAGRIALAASRSGVKRAIVTGPDTARSELAQAFALLDITLCERLPPRLWLKLRFWKS